MKRRNFIKLAALAGLGTAGAAYWPDDGITLPCLDDRTPEDLLKHDLVLAAWEGVQADQYWDIHTHLIGTGDGNSGIWLHPDMQNPLAPFQYIRFLFYINAACAEQKDMGLDAGYVQRLLRLYEDFPDGAKSMFLAFDFRHDEQGQIDKNISPFHTPDKYAAHVAHQHSDRFEWIASIHPYRTDCVEALELAVRQGARAVKWLPPVMNIDPASAKCDRFYAAMARLHIPLLTHAGDEHAVDGVDAQALGNPLLLRRALEHGVRVIIAHCATMGSNVDIDKGPNAARQENFQLFARLMNEQQYEGRLFGDISAITQLNRVGDYTHLILENDQWHHRLLNGSDYPLPGVMPLFSAKKLQRLKLLDHRAVKPLTLLRQYNPLLFDFVLKRNLRSKGKGFAPDVFNTRQVFDTKQV